MPIQKGFGIFSWIGFDKATIRMRHIKAEIMESNQLAANIAIGLTKIYLRMTRQVRQWHEHFFLPSCSLVNIVAYDGIAASKSMFIAQPLQYPHHSMALFDMNLFVGFQNGINDAGESR